VLHCTRRAGKPPRRRFEMVNALVALAVVVAVVLYDLYVLHPAPAA